MKEDIFLRYLLFVSVYFFSFSTKRHHRVTKKTPGDLYCMAREKASSKISTKWWLAVPNNGGSLTWLLMARSSASIRITKRTGDLAATRFLPAMGRHGFKRRRSKKPSMISNRYGRQHDVFFFYARRGGRYCMHQPFWGEKNARKDSLGAQPGRENTFVGPLYGDGLWYFVADLGGKKTHQTAPRTHPVMIAEGTNLSKKNDKIVSVNGRIMVIWFVTLWTSNGKHVKTRSPMKLGYAMEGAFVPQNGKKIVFRASRFKHDEEKKELIDIENKGLVAPNRHGEKSYL